LAECYQAVEIYTGTWPIAPERLHFQQGATTVIEEWDDQKDGDSGEHSLSILAAIATRSEERATLGS